MYLERQHTRTASLVMPVAGPGEPRTIKKKVGSAAHGVQVLVWGCAFALRAVRLCKLEQSW